MFVSRTCLKGSGSRLAPRGNCLSELVRALVPDLALRLLDDLLDRLDGLTRRPRDHRAGAGRASLGEERAVQRVGRLRLRDTVAAGRQEAALPAAADVFAGLVAAVAVLLVGEQEE